MSQDAHRSLFPTTQWSAIERWQQGGEETKHDALGHLLPLYRRPVLLKIQHHQRCNPDQAEELTQQFLLQCLRREFLRRVQPGEGRRFRYFIKACLGHFLRDLADHQQTEKERHLREAVRLDAPADAEGRPGPALVDRQPLPDELLDLEWALTLLNRTLDRLEEECAQQRHRTLFRTLRASLAGEPSSESTKQAAARLGTTEENVKVIAFRLRKRLGALIAEEVRSTVDDADDWQDELRYMVGLLGRLGARVTLDGRDRLVSLA